MRDWQSGYVNTNGIRMHYWRTGGGGLPVVLSHGATDSGLCWTRTALALQGDYDVIMVDARGHGLSDKPSSEYGPRFSGDDLAGLIVGLELDRPHLVGHSMGGEISANCVADHPGTARSLVILDSGFISNGGPYRGSSEGAEERIARSRAGVEEMRALGMEGLLARLSKESPNWHELERAPWAASKLQVSPEYGRFFAQDKRPWQEIIAAVDCPMLMIADPGLGSHTEWEAAIEATGLWKEGNLLHINGAGHNLQRDRWEVFMDRLTTWLAGH